VTERYEDLGGQPASIRVATPGARRTNKPHAGLCNHPDGHECPWLDETTPGGQAVRCRCADQIALIEVSDPGVKKVPPAKSPIREKVTWTRYTAVKAHKCDHCQLALWTLKGVGPLSRKARFKRTCGDDVLFLCDAHKQDQRIADGLPPELHDRKKKID